MAHLLAPIPVLDAAKPMGYHIHSGPGQERFSDQLSSSAHGNRNRGWKAADSTDALNPASDGTRGVNPGPEGRKQEDRGDGAQDDGGNIERDPERPAQCLPHA